MQLLHFVMGTVNYAVNILDICSLERPTVISKIPYQSENIKGITTIRDSVMPVYNLANRLNLPPQEDNRYFMVVTHNNNNMAIEINNVLNIIDINENELENMPSSFIQDVTIIQKAIHRPEGLTMILDTAELFRDHELSIENSIQHTVDSMDFVESANFDSSIQSTAC